MIKFERIFRSLIETRFRYEELIRESHASGEFSAPNVENERCEDGLEASDQEDSRLK